MAVTPLSTVTSEVLFQSGLFGPITVRTNGADIKPGMAVTMTGETISSLDIDIPSAADEIIAGIVGLTPNHNIDAVYADNTAVPLFLKGSCAVVWGWYKANVGDVRTGTPLIQTGAAGADGFASPGELVNEYIGLAYCDSANDAANDRPALIFLA